MGRLSCSSCGSTGRISRSRMSNDGYENYYETCMSCSGRGYHHTPDPPIRHVPKRSGKKRGSGPEANTPTPAAPRRPKQEATFEGFMGLVVAVGAVWLVVESDAQLPWWGWLLLFFVPLIGVTKLLERYPERSKMMKKLVIGGAVIAVVGYFLSQGG